MADHQSVIKRKEWTQKRISLRGGRLDIDLRHWEERKKSGEEIVYDPWNDIEKDTGIRRPKSGDLNCSNTSSKLIPTLSLIPFYDRVYFWYDPLFYPKNNELPSRIRTSAQFKEAYGLSPEEVILLAEEGNIIPVSGWPEEGKFGFSDYMLEEFIYKLENKSIPHLSFPDIQRITNFFQIKNSVYLPTPATHPDFNSRNFDLMDFLIKVASLETAWANNQSIPHSKEIMRILDIMGKGSKSKEQIDLIKNNINPSYFIDNLDLIYSPRIDLKEYIKIFSEERRKNLRKMIKDVIKSEKSADDFLYEFNQAKREFKQKSESRGWKVFSAVSSFAKPNLLTVTSAIGGAVIGSQLGEAGIGTLIAPLLEKLIEVKIPGKFKDDVNRKIADKIISPVLTPIFRQKKYPYLIHFVQMQREIKELSKKVEE